MKRNSPSHVSRHSLPVLLVDDEQQILLGYRAMLLTQGIENILAVDDSRNVLPLLSGQDMSAVVLDLNMPHIPGLVLLEKIRSEFPHLAVIIVTAANDVEKAVECMKIGATDYLVKPVEDNRFISSVKKALELNSMGEEITSLREHISSLRHHLLTDKLEYEQAFSSILTQSKKMRAVFHYIETISRSREPVLVTGETGAGKELVSKAIHDISEMSGAFVAVNAAGLDDTIFSDTLFGHKKGAYTGADKDRDGLIVRASGGTLFLDEFADLNIMSQIKLLRLIEDGTYYPLGSDLPEKSDARIIAATNRDINKLVSEGKFREDLYYRLSVIQVQIPPLRERFEDLYVLADHFLEMSARSLKKKKPTPPNELISLLSSYHYPGNIRELKAIIFDAVAKHSSGVLSLGCVKEYFIRQGKYMQPVISIPNSGKTAMPDISGRFPTLKEAEDFIVTEALKRSNGNQGIAASLLGITRQALNSRLKTLRSRP
ncbi:MAG: sigma-54-dependent Fis family transcriptional regulator [Nitrospirae bacterium]|nr:sigma-54-dependent Fis family transcriptional regulator [Nitrospirota bacterium]